MDHLRGSVVVLAARHLQSFLPSHALPPARPRPQAGRVLSAGGAGLQLRHDGLQFQGGGEGKEL